MYYVYILKLSDKKYYSGFSSDIKSRLKEHKQNRIKATKGLSPKLHFYSAFRTKKKALDFEKYLKSSSGFAFRNKRLV